MGVVGETGETESAKQDDETKCGVPDIAEAEELTKERKVHRGSDRHTSSLEDVEKYLLRLASVISEPGRPRTNDQPVREARHHKPLDVVRDAVVAALEQCQSLGRAKQSKGPTRAYAEIET